MLAARARGLGTAWTTLHLRYEKEISELLGIPADIRQGVLIPTAYYIGDMFKPAPRRLGRRAPHQRLVSGTAATVSTITLPRLTNRVIMDRRAVPTASRRSDPDPGC